MDSLAGCSPCREHERETKWLKAIWFHLDERSLSEDHARLSIRMLSCFLPWDRGQVPGPSIEAPHGIGSPRPGLVGFENQLLNQKEHRKNCSMDPYWSTRFASFKLAILRKGRNWYLLGVQRSPSSSVFLPL